MLRGLSYLLVACRQLFAAVRLMCDCDRLVSACRLRMSSNLPLLVLSMLFVPSIASPSHLHSTFAVSNAALCITQTSIRHLVNSAVNAEIEPEEDDAESAYESNAESISDYEARLEAQAEASSSPVAFSSKAERAAYRMERSKLRHELWKMRQAHRADAKVQVEAAGQSTVDQASIDRDMQAMNQSAISTADWNMSRIWNSNSNSNSNSTLIYNTTDCPPRSDSSTTIDRNRMWHRILAARRQMQLKEQSFPVLNVTKHLQHKSRFRSRAIVDSRTHAINMPTNERCK